MKRNLMGNSTMRVPLKSRRISSSYPLFSLKNINISRKDLLTKEMEMRFVILALPGYPRVGLMISKLFVYFDL